MGVARDGQPIFRSEAQDQEHLTLGGHWSPAQAVELRASVQGLRVDRIAGPGDIRLGTAARVWAPGPEIWLDWQVKLPNADETTGHGTDETDTRGMVFVRASRPRWHAQAGAGLEILGDPWQRAAQEDRMAAQLDAAWRFGTAWVVVGVDARLLAPHFPAEARARVRGERPIGERTWLGLEGHVGLTGAAYDFGGAAVVRLVPSGSGS